MENKELQKIKKAKLKEEKKKAKKLAKESKKAYKQQKKNEKAALLDEAQTNLGDIEVNETEVAKLKEEKKEKTKVKKEKTEKEKKDYKTAFKEFPVKMVKEINKIKWSGSANLTKKYITVLVFMAIFAVVFYFVDWGLETLFTAIKVI